MRKFMDTKLDEYRSTLSETEKSQERSIVFIGGDLNVNSLEGKLDKEFLSPHFDSNEFVQNFIEGVGKDTRYYEYDLMVHILSNGKKDKLTDLACEFFGEHPSTYSNWQTDPRTTEIMYKQDYWTSRKKLGVGLKDQSLDYFFVLEPEFETSSPNGRPKIEKFVSEVKEFKNPDWDFKGDRTLDDNDDWQYTSDHYGVESKLTLSF